MTNTANVLAIIVNLETIIGTTLGFKLEYEVIADESVSISPMAVIEYSGESFEESFGEKPLYNEISFVIMIRFRESVPAEIRSRAATYIHSIREGVTIDKLNIGDLSASQIVSRVQHDANDVVLALPIIQVNYELLVRYREV